MFTFCEHQSTFCEIIVVFIPEMGQYCPMNALQKTILSELAYKEKSPADIAKSTGVSKQYVYRIQEKYKDILPKLQETTAIEVSTPLIKLHKNTLQIICDYMEAMASGNDEDIEKQKNRIEKGGMTAGVFLKVTEKYIERLAVLTGLITDGAYARAQARVPVDDQKINPAIMDAIGITLTRSLQLTGREVDGVLPHKGQQSAQPIDIVENT